VKEDEMGTSMTAEEAERVYKVASRDAETMAYERREAARGSVLSQRIGHAAGLAALAAEAERRGRAAALRDVTAWLRSDACGPYTGVGDVIADAIDAGDVPTTPGPTR